MVLRLLLAGEDAGGYQPGAGKHVELVAELAERDVVVVGAVSRGAESTGLLLAPPPGSVESCASLPACGVSEAGVSCCVLVLVDQSTKDVAATQPTQVRRTPCFGTLRWHRRRMGQAAVRAALVVMLDVASQDVNKLSTTDHQQLV